MSTRKVLTILYLLASLPGILLIEILVRSRVGCLAKDLDRCIDAVDSAVAIPTFYVDALVAAEDHRSFLHCGVDYVAVLRALYVRLVHGRIEGASTIEQQLVRVATGRFERTLARKLREQLLALAVSSRRGKHSIASAYLGLGFYGSGSEGYEGLTAIVGRNLGEAAPVEVLRVIAQLKYPRPRSPSEIWDRKCQQRVQYITQRLAECSHTRWSKLTSLAGSRL